MEEKKNDKKNMLEGSTEFHQVLEELSGADVRLSAHADLNKLLVDSLREARMFTNADGGSLYMRYGDILVFEIFQNDTLERAGRLTAFKKFETLHFQINPSSLAGLCAQKKETILIDDVQKNEYFNSELDQALYYTTETMMAVPLLDDENSLVGVMQLINAREGTAMTDNTSGSTNKSKSQGGSGKVIPFKESDQEKIESLANNIAVAIRGFSEEKSEG